ncbi:MAG: hypothetical protein GXY41_03370 [Phycisphaerae bacterium]|nr:hypothetical protein [Phycisphaerae bacterium]
MNNSEYQTMESNMRPKGKAMDTIGRIRISGLWLAALTVALTGLWAYSESNDGPLRSRTYKLRHLNSSAARDLLVRLKIGAEYNTLSSDVLIVTSTRSLDLARATSVITTADRETSVEIRPLMALSEDVPLPKPEELAVRLRMLTIGTLTEGPPAGVPNPTIIDEFEGTLIAIGTPDALEQIETVIEAWKAEKSPKQEQIPSPAPDPALPQTMPTEQSDPQSSLADIAALLFGDEPNEPVTAPNAIEEHPEQMLTDTPPQPVTEAEPEDPVVLSQPEIQQPTEPAEAADEPDADDAILRAALERLLGSADQQEPQTTPSAEEDPAAMTEGEPEMQPSDEPTRIVTRPSLPAEQADKELEVTITLPEEVEIEKLLELVGKQLGLNYMYDRAIFAGAPGRVNLSIHDGRIKVGDLYALLESVLRFRGFVMTRRGSLVTIVRQAEIAAVDPVLRRPDEEIRPGDIMVSSVFKLNNVAPATAQTLLSQMRLGTGFNVIHETGTLIVTDYAFRMERIRDLIAMIDVEGEPKDFQFRQLRYMDAEELVPKIRALSTQIQGVTITVGAQPAAAVPTAAATRALTATERAAELRAATATAAAARTATATAARTAQPQAAQGESLYLEADGRTNRILMIGYTQEIDLVNQLIDSLDVPSYDLRFVREYVIQYVEATDVVTVLGELGLAQVSVGTAQPTSRTATAAATAARTAQPAAGQPTVQQTTARGAGTNNPYISLRAATNSLLVNATDEQHKAIELVISHVDVMQKDQRTIKEYEIQYVDTQSILDTLGELGIITPRTTGTATGTRTGTTAQTAARPGQPAEGTAQSVMLLGAEGEGREITAQEPQIAVLGATNSLLIYATPRQHSAIAMVIAHTDRQRSRMFAPYVVYALENKDPAELADILNQLIKETIEEAATGTPSAPDARIQTRPTQTVATLPSGEEQRIRIVADTKTYSLIVYANQRNQQWVGELIRELDAYRPQVLLDVTLVEISRDDDFNYAINILNSIPDLTNTSGITDTFSGVGEAVYNKDDILTRLLAPGSDRSQFIDLKSNQGRFTGFYGNDKVMALLTAMQTKKYGRIMANPKLLVNDNEQGTIETKTTTYITRTTVNYLQGTSGTTNTLTPVESQTFDPYDASIKMDITPRISKGDNLRLEITLNRSDFLGFDPTSERPPNKAESDVQTVVTVPDGYTIILGGMDKVNQSKGGTKVPILGDLPLIGGLFRSTSNTSQENKLYVFVKANILRPGTDLASEDLKNISSEYQIEFEGIESEMQGYEDWPGIKPKPMTPDRVLRRGN